MPQLQLPMFPAGVTEINTRVAVEAKDGRVCYIHGHLPVFQHDEKDVWSFRMFTSQMIVNVVARLYRKRWAPRREGQSPARASARRAIAPTAVWVVRPTRGARMRRKTCRQALCGRSW